MKKNRIESFFREVLQFLLSIPFKLWIEVALLVVLFWMGIDFSQKAQRQYSPVVQRIHFDCNNIRNAQWIDVEAAWDQDLDENVKGPIAGRQYLELNLQAVECADSCTAVPDEVAALTEAPLKYYSSVSVTASGDDWDLSDMPVSDQWALQTEGRAVRVSDSRDGHMHIIEQYSDSRISTAKIVMRGNHIFNDSDTLNPFLSFHLTFEQNEKWLRDSAQGSFTFYYNHSAQDTVLSESYATPIQVISVSPEPDYITPTEIGFTKSFDTILQHGAYVIAEDISKRRSYEIQTFLCSVFLGVVITLFIQTLLAALSDTLEWLNLRKARREQKQIER